jgi:hypothetical protein
LLVRGIAWHRQRYSGGIVQHGTGLIDYDVEYGVESMFDI